MHDLAASFSTRRVVFVLIRYQFVFRVFNDSGSIGDRCGIGLASIWDRFEIDLGSVRDRFGIGLGSIWDKFWG